MAGINHVVCHGKLSHRYLILRKKNCQKSYLKLFHSDLFLKQYARSRFRYAAEICCTNISPTRPNPKTASE